MRLRSLADEFVCNRRAGELIDSDGGALRLTLRRRRPGPAAGPVYIAVPLAAAPTFTRCGARFCCSSY